MSVATDADVFGINENHGGGKLENGKEIELESSFFPPV
jgi:hypothetical protein